MVEGAVTIIVATFLLFGVITLLPGDPVRALFGFGPVDVEVYNQIAERLHLDEPFLAQYWHFLEGLVTLDLGGTLRGAPILPMVKGALTPSMQILGGVFALQLMFAPAAVVIGGLRPRSPVDKFTNGLSVLLVSVPVIVAALLLQALATAVIQGLDATVTISGQVVPIRSAAGYGLIYGRLLPILALGLGTAGHLALVGREELLMALSQPFAKTARAFGIPRGRLVRVTALRPSLGPTIQLLAANMAVLVTGLIVVEGVFMVDGVGGLLLDAIREQDRILVVTLLSLVLIGVIVVNTLADLVHGWLDPRVRDEVT